MMVWRPKRFEENWGLQKYVLLYGEDIMIELYALQQGNESN
jgi:hypothetical protein